MTGSARVMTSPSSSRTILSTPCVDGCCGPMLRIISWVPSVPWGTISISTPPPRTIQFSEAAVKAARSSVSTVSILPRTGGSDQRAREAAAGPVVGWRTMARAERERTGNAIGNAGPEPRRRIPSVDALLRSEPGRRASGTFGRPLVKHALSITLEQVRGAAERGTEPPPDDEILARALGLTSATAAGLVRVINATGVVLHTGLGRAPLPARAAAAAARAGQGYVDLEVDRGTGARERRSTRAERLLTSMTGAEDALVVNNGAAALLLALASLARGKSVLVSRGELIEIGGEFRIPDIMAASGARLVEVGTTNRTRASDYRSALSDKTALILKVHPSNYRVVGFASTPSAKDLAGIARRANLPFLYDLGSGLLERVPGAAADEPSATDALADGADLIVFSGDKLLGGPQAGIVLGRSE